MVCRRVQVLRPRRSMSGGHSAAAAAGAWVGAEGEGEGVEEGVAIFFLVMAAQEAMEVQERQLWGLRRQL